MNIIKKIYCRSFQWVFKMAMPILPYRNPRLYKNIEDIPIALKEKTVNSVLLVTDKAVSKIKAFSKLINALDAENIKYVIFDKTVANPTVENVEAAKCIYIESKSQALIGFGGGSSIDCAKAVGARLVRKNMPIHKMKGILKILKKTPLFIAVPTTAGTGSEVTVTSVITDEKTHHKFPISDFCLIPDVAVLDPDTTKTLPKNIVATTGMDALTHAVEAYIGNSTNKHTRKDAIDALKLIFENLPEAYENPGNDKARANMLYASFLAGRAFSKSYVGYCHAVAHSLGGKYNIPHGLANAVIIPYVLKEYGECIHGKLKELAVATNIAKKDTKDEIAAQMFIKKIENLNESMGIPKHLTGICDEDIKELAKCADKEANPLYPVPKLMDAGELERFYHLVKE